MRVAILAVLLQAALAWYVPDNAAEFTEQEAWDCLKHDECWKTYLLVGHKHADQITTLKSDKTT